MKYAIPLVESENRNQSTLLSLETVVAMDAAISTRIEVQTHAASIYQSVRLNDRTNMYALRRLLKA